MKRHNRKTTDTSVVAAVAQQTAEAADLARIDGQERLLSPRTNPAVRKHADGLRDDEQRRELDAAHGRAVRTIRVADRRADNAERALEALQAARETSSAARSVLALHQGRTRFMGAALGASLTLSAGSAIGVAALAVKHGNPAEIGYIAEVGLTGLTTAVILYKSHLAQHGGQLAGWKDKVLWALMIGPLVASIVANAYGTGGVGVACSVGAAAFSLLSYVIADASAETLLAKAKEVSGEDELKLRKIATGAEHFGTAAPEPELGPAPELELALESGPELVPVLSPELGLVPVPELTSELESEPQAVNPNRNRVQICVGEDGLFQLAATRNAEVVLAPEPVLESAPEPTPAPQAARKVSAPQAGERAAKKADQVQQVLSLIEEFGFDNVRLPEVQELFGTAVPRTTAYNRLLEARADWNERQGSEPELGSRADS